MVMDKQYTNERHVNENTFIQAENTEKQNGLGLSGTYRRFSDIEKRDDINPHISVTKTPKVKPTSRRWIILVLCFCVQMMTVGFVYSLSVLFVPFLEVFGRTKAETSIIMSVLFGTFSLTGFPNGVLITKVGTRVAGLIGGVVMFVGISVSFFANGIPFLTISLGLLAGTGSSNLYITSATCIGYHFSGNAKLMALAFISFGSGVGAMGLPYILEALFQEYGLKGCLLVFGGIFANMIPCTALFTSPAYKSTNGNGIVKLSNGKHSDDALNNNAKKMETMFFSKMKAQLRELKENKVYIVYVIGIALTIPIVNVFSIVATDFLQNSKGFDRSTAILMLFLMNMSSTITKLLPGAIKKLAPSVSVFLIQLMHIVVGTIAAILFPFAVTYTHHVILVLTWGFMLGGTMSSMSVAIMKLVGEKNYATGFGILCSTIFIGSITSGPIAGHMVDTTGSYSSVFFTSAVGLFVGCCIFTLGYFMRLRQKQKQPGSLQTSGVLSWKKSYGLAL